MRFRRLLLVLSLFFSSLFFFQQLATGEELAAGFTVEGVPNERQVDENLSYFYLKEEPGQRDEIKLLLSNNSPEDKTLSINVVDANTNINGLVDYTGNLKNHTTLKTPLSSIVSEVKQEILVPKNSEVETTLKIEMPSRSFEGVVVGGVVISEKAEKDKATDSLVFRNTYSYTIAIVLTNEDKTEIKKHVSVELEKVQPVLFDGRKIVQADILNPNSYIFHEATVSGSIYKKSNNKKIIESKKDDVSIAPHSVYPFMFDWKKKKLEPGTYIFRGKVEAGKEKWVFEKEFTITAEQSNEINEKSVFKVSIPTWLEVSGIIVLITAIFTTILAVIRKQRKKG